MNEGRESCLSESDGSIEKEKKKYYVFPKNLEGMVLSNEKELRTLFPDKEVKKEIEKETSTSRGKYSFFYYGEMLGENIKFSARVAYECPRCSKIIVGAPLITLYLNTTILSKEEGIMFQCKYCGHDFHKKIESAS